MIQVYVFSEESPDRIEFITSRVTKRANDFLLKSFDKLFDVVITPSIARVATEYNGEGYDSTIFTITITADAHNPKETNRLYQDLINS